MCSCRCVIYALSLGETPTNSAWFFFTCLEMKPELANLSWTKPAKTEAHPPKTKLKHGNAEKQASVVSPTAAAINCEHYLKLLNCSCTQTKKTRATSSQTYRNPNPHAFLEVGQLKTRRHRMRKSYGPEQGDWELRMVQER